MSCSTPIGIDCLHVHMWPQVSTLVLRERNEARPHYRPLPACLQVVTAAEVSAPAMQSAAVLAL
jgi:hypothetical protein